MNADLQTARAFWDQWAEADPLWAVLSVEGKEACRWTLDEFMRSGEREIALLWNQLDVLGTEPPSSALDFGCGLGRLTQAMARRCSAVVGVDISPNMTRLASMVNAYPSAATYLTLDLDGIRARAPGSFDLVYSNVVLQHLLPDTVRCYLEELLRLTRRGGTLVFQLPSHRRQSTDPMIRSMPADAYRARLAVAEGAPTAMAAGEERQVRLSVENLSTVTWSQSDVGSIQAGNQWLDADGLRLVIQDDGRAVLPQVVPPRSPVDTVVTVRAPDEPGMYQLRFDVVHEGVTWFAGRSSQPLTVPVRISPSSGAAVASQVRSSIRELDVPAYDTERLHAQLATAGSVSPGDFPMAGVPVDSVLDIVRRAGGEVVLLEEGHRAGPEWVDFRYFVRLVR